jgi:hypothetical protein
MQMQTPMKKIEGPDRKVFYWRCEACGYETAEKKKIRGMLMNSLPVARDAEIKGRGSSGFSWYVMEGKGRDGNALV